MASWSELKWPWPSGSLKGYTVKGLGLGLCRGQDLEDISVYFGNMWAKMGPVDGPPESNALSGLIETPS